MRFSFFVVLAFVVSLTACGTDTTPPPAVDGGPVSDLGDGGGAVDARIVCTSDISCSDSVFCNGSEACAPGSAGADALGCIAGVPPCASGETCVETTEVCRACTIVDADADGVSECDGDCDDSDAGRFPGRSEICDAMSRDEDCDPTTFGFRDADSDGFTDATCCNHDPSGVDRCGVDCNDVAPGIHPTAVEACNSLDDDCNAEVDEGVLLTFYRDFDTDGFGTMDATMTVTGCTAPPGYVGAATDCDDTTAARNPAAPEACTLPLLDENCDGMENEGCSCVVGEGRACMSTGLCASGTQSCGSGTWNPCSITAVAETCNGLDDDCNGIPDDGVQTMCYVDNDDDGFAAVGAAIVLACSDPGRPLRGGCRANTTNLPPADTSTADCNDAIPTIRPGATEMCNGGDDNCNVTIDEGVTTIFYADCDGDSHGTRATTGLSACATPRTASACSAPSGYVASNDDCDDTTAAVHPGLTESCDCLDNDCNGAADDGITPAPTYRDSDADTYVDMTMVMASCCPVAGYISNPHPGAWDCNDTNRDVHPGAPTGCASLDWDCDGAATSGMVVWYADCDRDGYAAIGAASMSVCAMPAAAPASCPAGTWEYTNPPSAAGLADCNDANGSVHPFATELCDGLDDNCFAEPGHPMFGLGGPFEDVDDDGDPNCGAWSCPGAPAAVDCNDTNPTIRHGAAEIAGDGRDQNCDCMELCFTNVDGDAYRTATTVTTSDLACTGAGHASAAVPAGDCCDTSSITYPGATTTARAVGNGCATLPFDYNCDGAQTKTWPSARVGTCSVTDCDAGCVNEPSPGWASGSAGCGVTASYVTGCNTGYIPSTGCITCLGTYQTVSRQQTCR